MSKCKHCRDDIPHVFSEDVVQITRHKSVAYLFHLECFKEVAGGEYVPWVGEITYAKPTKATDVVRQNQIDKLSEKVSYCPNCDAFVVGRTSDCRCIIAKEA
jgi:predicted RNA-binding Zn-ribbon protein involved in translation (DUF1610 family)